MINEKSDKFKLMMCCDTCALNLFQDMKENYCVAQITIIVDRWRLHTVH